MNIYEVEPGKYYYIEHGMNKAIFLAKTNDRFDFSIRIDYNRYSYYKNNMWAKFDWIIREATSEESSWLDLCISENKLVPKPKFIEYEIY